MADPTDAESHYHDLAREERLRGAAGRWPLLRAVDQFIEVARWRNASAAEHGGATAPPGRTAEPAEPWFLAASPDDKDGTRS